MFEAKGYSPELQKCYFLYIHKQICSKMSILSYFVRPKRSSGNCYVNCFLTEKTSLVRRNLFSKKWAHFLSSFLNTQFGQSREILTSLPRFDLMSLIFGENSNHGQENYWKSGVQIPAPEGQNNFVLFSFHFQINYTKLGIFDFKVRTFWEALKIWKKSSTWFWQISWFTK